MIHLWNPVPRQAGLHRAPRGMSARLDDILANVFRWRDPTQEQDWVDTVTPPVVVWRNGTETDEPGRRET